MNDWPTWVWIMLIMQVSMFWAITRIEKHIKHHHKAVIGRLYPPPD